MDDIKEAGENICLESKMSDGIGNELYILMRTGRKLLKKYRS